MNVIKKISVLKEFFYMVRDRKSLFLIPVIISIILVSLFLSLLELPALFPFFYAVF